MCVVYWDDVENLRSFLIWAQDQLGIKQWTDWYKISNLQLTPLGGAGGKRVSVVLSFSLYYLFSPSPPSQSYPLTLLSPVSLLYSLVFLSRSLSAVKRWGGLFNALKLAFPSFPWEVEKFARKFAGGKTQSMLVDAVQQLMPNGEMRGERREESNIAQRHKEQRCMFPPSHIFSISFSPLLLFLPVSSSLPTSSLSLPLSPLRYYGCQQLHTPGHEIRRNAKSNGTRCLRSFFLSRIRVPRSATL